MAGYALGYEDGGAIPDDDQDNGPATVPAEAAPQQAPPADGESSASLPDMGDPPVAQELAQETPGQAGQRLGQQVGNDIGEGLQNIQKDPIVKRIASYLMGDGGADPAAAKKFQVGVQHEYPGINADDANLLAVHKAFELGGPQAAWQMVQYNRTAYNAKQSFAEAALQGVQNKAPDLRAAADAATQASQHVLDGSSTKFTAGPGGVTATVTMPGTTQPTTYQMTPQQFAQATSVGKDAQWDRLMETGGMPALLARIVGNPNNTMGGGAQPQQGGGKDTQDGAAPAGEDRVAQLKKVMGDFPISQDDINSGYDPDTIAKGYARFGHGVGQTAERNEWMAQQEDKEANRDNAVKVANEKGILANKRAEIMAGGRRAQEDTKGKYHVQVIEERNKGLHDTATIRADADSKRRAAQGQQALERLIQTTKNAQLRDAGLNAREEIRARGLTDPDDIGKVFEKHGVTQALKPFVQQQPPQPQQGQQQAASGQQPQQQQTAGKKLFNGKWYTREEYKQEFGK